MEKHKGKVIGGIVGALVGGPIGAGVGTFFGTMFDNEQEMDKLPLATFLIGKDGCCGVECPHCKNPNVLSEVGQHWSCPECNRGYCFNLTTENLNKCRNEYLFNFEYSIMNLFFMLGFLAKADGVVSPEEISHVEEVISKICETQDEKILFKNCFSEGKKANSIDNNSFILSWMLQHDEKMSVLVVRDLVHLCFADGYFHEKEKRALRKIVIDNFGASEEMFADIIRNAEEIYLGKPNYNTEVESAILELGCTLDSSLEEIKNAYKALCRKYHPDTLASKELPDEIIKLAEEKFKSISLAYEIIIINMEKKAA
jgi:DnaJ like chaperone protein